MSRWPSPFPLVYRWWMMTNRWKIVTSSFWLAIKSGGFGSSLPEALIHPVFAGNRGALRVNHWNVAKRRRRRRLRENLCNLQICVDTSQQVPSIGSSRLSRFRPSAARWNLADEQGHLNAFIFTHDFVCREIVEGNGNFKRNNTNAIGRISCFRCSALKKNQKFLFYCLLFCLSQKMLSAFITGRYSDSTDRIEVCWWEASCCANGCPIRGAIPSSEKRKKEKDVER